MDTNMDVGIQFEIQNLVGSFEEKQGELLSSLTVKMNDLAVQFAARVSEKLSGDLLEVRSGKLLKSVQVTPAAISEGMIGAAVSAGGPTAPYGIVQEVGVEHAWNIMPVDKKSLRFMLGGQEVFAMLSRHKPLPGKHFMELTAEEMQEQILTQIEETVRGIME